MTFHAGCLPRPPTGAPSHPHPNTPHPPHPRRLRCSVMEWSPHDRDFHVSSVLVTTPAPPSQVSQRLRQLASGRHLLTEAKRGIKWVLRWGRRLGSVCSPRQLHSCWRVAKTSSKRAAGGCATSRVSVTCG